MTADKAMDLQASLRQLDAWRGASAAGAQRRFQRFAARGEVRLRPGDGTPNAQNRMNGHLRDISRGGVGILCSQPSTPGQFWQLNLIDSNVVVATLPGFCRFCRQVVDGAFLIGVEFGVEASVILAMGISAKELASGDMAEHSRPLSGDFVGPESLLTNDAA